MTTTVADAQTWVYPPPGAATPANAATGNFGPVHFEDSMVLEWTPATKPQIDMTCISQAGSKVFFISNNCDLKLTNVDYTRSLVANLLTQPLTYQFTNTANQVSDTDLIFCHFFFSPSTLGNTITWQFVNQPNDEPVTWSAPSISSATSSSTSSSTAPTSTSTSVSSVKDTPTALITTTAIPNTVTNKSALPPGAIAGIVVGVTVPVIIAAIALVAFVIMFTRRRRPRPPKKDLGTVSEYGYPSRTQYMAELETKERTGELDGRGFVEKQAKIGELPA